MTATPVPSGTSDFDRVHQAWKNLEGAALKALQHLPPPPPDPDSHSPAESVAAELLEALDDIDWARRVAEGLEQP